MVFVGVVLKGLLGGTTFDGKSLFKSFKQANNIRITSSSNTIMSSDSYPILFNSKNFSFSSLLPFLPTCIHVQSPGVQE